MTLLALGEGSLDGLLGAAPLVRPLKEPKREECAEHCHHPRYLIAGATHAVKRCARESSAHGSLSAARERLATGWFEERAMRGFCTLAGSLTGFSNPCAELRSPPPKPEESFSGNRMRDTDRFLSILGMAAWAKDECEH